MKEITERLDVSKSSVSIWVRDIELSKAQLDHLREKGLSRDVIEKRRATRLAREKDRRDKIITKARNSVLPISRKELFLVGIALYWGEGSKTRRGIVEFAP